MVNLFKLLSELRNGYKAHKTRICIRPSKHCQKFLGILQAYGFIYGVSLIENGKLKVYLRYTREKNAIFSLGGLSKPSLPIYLSAQDLWKFHKSYGILILNTPYGLICHHTALKQKSGGQVICYIL